MTPQSRPGDAKATVGWREWVGLPDLADTPIKAKVDTGARTSALHAFSLRITEVDGTSVATFEVHPDQRSTVGWVEVSCEVLGFRHVRSSNGRTENRPVIRTTASLGDRRWPIEVTLTSRDTMGFRMLLGRSALKGRFLVDPGRSYLQSWEVQSRHLPSRRNRQPQESAHGDDRTGGG